MPARHMPLLGWAVMVSDELGFMLAPDAGTAIAATGFIAWCGATVLADIVLGAIVAGTGAIVLADMLVWASAAPPPARQSPAPRATARVENFSVIKSLREDLGAGLARPTEHRRVAAWRPMPFEHVFDAWKRQAESDMVAM